MQQLVEACNKSQYVTTVEVGHTLKTFHLSSSG